MKFDRDIQNIVEFIKDNPPTNKSGDVEWWSNEIWNQRFYETFPNYQKLLGLKQTWKELRTVRPRDHYSDFLEYALPFAPIETLKEYFQSSLREEHDIATSIFLDYGSKLTPEMWNSSDSIFKKMVISEVLKKITTRKNKQLDNMLYRIKKNVRDFDYRNAYTLELIGYLLHKNYDFTKPLWYFVKNTILESGDSKFYKILEDFERQSEDQYEKNLKILNRLELEYPSPTPDVSNNIMFDPSLLMNKEKLKRSLDFIHNNKNFNYFISDEFNSIILNENSDYQEITKFFEAEDVDWRYTRNMLNEYKETISNFSISDDYLTKHEKFHDILFERVENRNLRNILFEEWVFLQEYSWVTAQSKKVFEKFTECGSWVLEGSEKSLDLAVKKTLKKNSEDIINRSDKLRALGKWIATGITPASAYFSPMIATGIGIPLGFFLLIDPE